MKKLLAILSSTSLLLAPLTVISCNAKNDDIKKQNILDVINLAKVNASNLTFDKFLNNKNTYEDLDNYISQDLIPQVTKLINDHYSLNNYIKNDDLIYVIRDQIGRVVDLSQKNDKLKNGKWYLDFYGNKPYIGNRIVSILTIKGNSFEYISLNSAKLPMVEFMTTAKEYINDLKTDKAEILMSEIQSQLEDSLKGTFTIDDLEISIKYQSNWDTLDPKYVEVLGDEIIGGRFGNVRTWEKDNMANRQEWFTFIKLKNGVNSNIEGELKYLHRIKESAVWTMEINSYKTPHFVTGQVTTADVVNAVLSEKMREIFIKDLSPFLNSKWANKNFPNISEWVHLDNLLDKKLRPKPGEVTLNQRGSFTLKLAFNKDWKTGRELTNNDVLRGYIEIWINIV